MGSFLGASSATVARSTRQSRSSEAALVSSPRGTIPGPAVETPASAAARAAALPDAAPTFLFTDVEGSTRLWEQNPREMQSALARHDVLLRTAIAGADGDVVKTTGDGLMAVFGAPVAAVSAAISAQRALLAETWPSACAIRVRMGIHTGEAEARGGDFFGPAVNRAARIMAVGHGGQILLSGATADLLDGGLPATATLRDLGEHRLKDLGRPEHLFQLADQDLPSEFPPLSTLDRRPNNLPIQASAFVGRDAVLADLRERLDDAGIRLVTLTGPGGTGKTRLALRAAADQIDRFTDGVFFVDLITATDGDGVLALIVSAVGIADATERSPLNELRRQFRSQRVLLVLDNFEQVTVAGPVLLDLLSECPGLKLLVTSRQALRVRGENVVSVPPLSMPAAAAHATTAVELSQFEAIQLFVERARAVRSDFRLTDDNASAVAEICRRLDGLPLAIELATARMNLFSPEALRDRLGSRLKLLGGGARDLPKRQQTLRATIEWSYQLLEPAEQRLLELLSVFAGSSVEAVEAVATGLDEAAGIELNALDGLSSLLDKSLVRQADATGGDSAQRIVMLETIREYAAEQLDARAEFAVAAREHHALYFVDYAADASKAGADLESSADEDAIALESDNLRLAWRHWVAQGDLGRLKQLKGVLWPLYDRRGWYHATVEVIRDMQGVLAAMPDRADHWQEELTLRTTLARALTLLRGYTGEAEDAYVEALTLLQDHPDVPLLFPVLRNLASFHGFRGELDQALDYAHQILRLADAENDPGMRVDGKFIIGSNTGFGGDLATGLGDLDEAIRAFETEGYRPRRFRLGLDVRVSCLTTSGFFLWLMGRPDEAVERADRAVAIATELDHPYSLAYGLFHSGFLHLWRREPEVVLARATAAMRVAEASEIPIWRALGTCLIGAATSGLGRPAEGLRQIADGLDQYQDLRTPPVFWPFIRFIQAGAHVDAGTPGPGFPLIDEAIALGGLTNPIAPLFHIVRGDLSLAGPRPDAATATECYEEAFAMAERLGARMPQLRAAGRLCRIATPDDRPARIDALRAVHSTFTDGLAAPDLLEAAELLG
jgi:predicted ATPase/class 3 adenylate cyclase